MGTVTVEVNGRAYQVGCEDGQEAHVESLARTFSAQVREVSRSVGQVGDLRLFLMAALLGADESADLRGRLARAEAELAAVRRGGAEPDGRAMKALEAAADRIEALLEI